MEKQPLSLKERQIEYLRLLKELDSFCTANNILYYIGCGTLIGAVRHNGFIPWDDDLDVFMPEPDFIKFEKAYQSDCYEIHSCWNDKSCRMFFPRLCNKNIVSEIRGKRYDGFGIDIYIIYGAPSNKEEQEKHKDRVFHYLRRAKRLARFRDGLARRGLWPGRSLKFGYLNNAIKRVIKEFRKYDYSNCDYIWPCGGGRINMKKELYGNPVRLQFEDGFFEAPEHYDEVLRASYGDYMQLPPEENRHPYHCVEYYRK